MDHGGTQEIGVERAAGLEDGEQLAGGGEERVGVGAALERKGRGAARARRLCAGEASGMAELRWDGTMW